MTNLTIALSRRAVVIASAGAAAATLLPSAAFATLKPTTSKGDGMNDL